MANFVRHWMEALDKITFRPPHQNPIPVGTAGMDQVNTSGPEPKDHPQPVDWEILGELAELKRKLTGRPHGIELGDGEKDRIKGRIKELQEMLSRSPDDADATYGLRKVPVTDKPEEADLKPSEINKKLGG